MRCIIYKQGWFIGIFRFTAFTWGNRISCAIDNKEGKLNAELVAISGTRGALPPLRYHFCQQSVMDENVFSLLFLTVVPVILGLSQFSEL
jgi:hypothetical protein